MVPLLFCFTAYTYVPGILFLVYNCYEIILKIRC